MKRIVLILTILFFGLKGFGQSEAANWYFGFGAGIRFDQSSGTIIADGGSINTYEGCSSISNEKGNLLFTTDGINVYDRNHSLMPNGKGLLGDPSSSQSAIIVPKPKTKNIYYVFTVGAIGGSGLNYTEIDMNLNNGLGDVTKKNIRLLGFTSEKVSAVLKDCETGSIWVVTLGPNSRGGGSGNGYFDTFHAFEVSTAGVNPNSVRSRFPKLSPILDARGYLKISPDGSKLASASIIGGLFLYDFDKNTGIVSNEEQLNIDSGNNFPYGVEFSPNSQLLYVSSYNNVPFDPNGVDDPKNHSSSLIQYDVTVPHIEVSETQILLDERQLFRGALQLGPDGRIYRALSATYSEGIPFLGVIDNPNLRGLACGYRHNAIPLSANSAQGLPPFIQSFFNVQIDIIQNGQSSTNLALCGNEAYTLMGDNISGAIYNWTLDDNPLPENDFDLEISSSGHYKLLIDPNDGGCGIEGEAYVSIYNKPDAIKPEKLNVCDENNDGVSLIDFTVMDSKILGQQDPKVYRVHYYPSLQDAENNTNEIFNTYKNINNPQEIFVRVAVDRNIDCYDTTSFLLEVFDSPKANSINDFSICDDISDGNQNNGKRYFDLSTLNQDIMGNQDDSKYTISYFKDEFDANLNINPLPNLYYNESPFKETIFVRIENNKNTDCYDITSFTMTINSIPESIDTELTQCDEDGVQDGITLFNLNEVNDDLTKGISNRSTKFYTNLIDAENSINEVDGTSFVNSTNPQTIYAQVINNDTGCFDIAELTLNISTTHSKNASLTVCDDDGLEDGFYLFNLSDAKSDILEGLSNGLDISFFKTYNDALLEQNNLDTFFTNEEPFSQTIYARVENFNNCYGISELQLIVYSLPDIETEERIYYCLNTFPNTITLNAKILGDDFDNYSYEWSTGEITYEIKINEPGTYTVSVTNANNCSKEKNITVRASNIASIESIDIKDMTSNNKVTVLVSGEGTYEYALYDNNNHIYKPFQESNVFENIFPGFYTVHVRDVKNNCGLTYEEISVIGFPKFFTPNNDGTNDSWQIYGVSDMFQPKSKILIFDRYGKLLKQLSPLEKGWDGIFNGKPLPSDDYWFSVILEDGRVFKNHFSLKR